MAKGYEVLVGKGGRLLVVLHRACQITKGEILALLAEAGIDPATVTFVEPEGVAECGDLGDAAVIIPLDDVACDKPELESVGRQCGTAGARVVVLFGPACSFKGLHPIADRYGTQCDWSAERLNGWIGGEEDVPRDPTGNSAKRPAAREVVCRR